LASWVVLIIINIVLCNYDLLNCICKTYYTYTGNITVFIQIYCIVADIFNILKIMLSLISLLLISGLFIVCLLIISNNYQVIINNFKTNRFAQALLLEESSYIVPYVIRKYYSYIINIRSKIVPSIFTTSY